MYDNIKEPLISVAMGTYNGSRRIKKAVESILNQSYTNFELIICDDASTDDTLEIITDMAAKDKRIVIISNKVNSGLNISLNKCIEAAHGKYIARMDDDDLSVHNRFEMQVEFLEGHPEYAIVGCSKRYFDEHGIWGQAKAKTCPTIVDVFTSHAFSHPTVMMRRDALQAVGMYSTDKINRRGQDYDLWCKLYLAGFKGYNLPDYLFDYYESKTSVSRRKLKFRIDHIKKQVIWRKRLGLPISFLRYPFMDVIKCFLPSFLYRRFRKRRFK